MDAVVFLHPCLGWSGLKNNISPATSVNFHLRQVGSNVVIFITLWKEESVNIIQNCHRPCLCVKGNKNKASSQKKRFKRAVFTLKENIYHLRTELILNRQCLQSLALQDILADFLLFSVEDEADNNTIYKPTTEPDNRDPMKQPGSCVGCIFPLKPCWPAALNFAAEWKGFKL